MAHPEHEHDPPRVDRCVCFDVSFATMKRWADAQRMERGDASTFEDLQERFGCGRGCGLCVPYIRRMLETGMTELPVQWPP